MELREECQPNKTLHENRISFQGNKSITAAPTPAKIIFDENCGMCLYYDFSCLVRIYSKHKSSVNDCKSSCAKQLAVAAGLTKGYPHDCDGKEEESEQSDQDSCINGSKTGDRETSSFPKKKKYKNIRRIKKRHPVNPSTRSSSLPTISEEEEVPAVFDNANELPPLVGWADKRYDYYILPNILFSTEDDLDDIAFENNDFSRYGT